MARKDTPWQADFNKRDRKLIIEWINKNLHPWDRWGLPLAELAWRRGDAPAPDFTFRTTDFQGKPVTLTAKVNPALRLGEAKRAFRTLGLPFADQYIAALRDFCARHQPAMSKDGVFANMWLKLFEGGAAVHLEEILTADPENRERWTRRLKAHGKTWADVRISDKAAALIAEEILRTLSRQLGFPARTWDALRKDFEKYTKRYFGGRRTKK